MSAFRESRLDQVDGGIPDSWPAACDALLKASGPVEEVVLPPAIAKPLITAAAPYFAL